MYNDNTPTIRNFAMKELSQIASFSVCERNWSTFALIHTKQKTKLAYITRSRKWHCYYNMKLKLKDMEVEEENYQDFNPTIVFDVIVDDSDENGNQLYEWIKPFHLDNKEENLDPRITSQEEEECMNVTKVIFEKVDSSSSDFFIKLIRELTRTLNASTISEGICSEF